MEESKISKVTVEVPDEQKPSILEILVDKHNSIEKSVMLLRREILVQENLSLNPSTEIADGKQTKEKPKEEELNGLSDLLGDAKVNSIIKAVAGDDTSKIIDQTLNVLKSGSPIEFKHQALANGIKKLQSNLSKGDKLPVRDDPAFKLALSLIGINRNKLD